MSRSVIMPTRRSPSRTGMMPASISAISRAASRMVWFGSISRTSRVMTSATRISISIAPVAVAGSAAGSSLLRQGPLRLGRGLRFPRVPHANGPASGAPAARRGIVAPCDGPLHLNLGVGCDLNPDGLHFAWERVLDLLDLPRVRMPRQDPEHGLGRVAGIDRADLSQLLTDGLQERIQRAGLL